MADNDGQNADKWGKNADFVSFGKNIRALATAKMRSKRRKKYLTDNPGSASLPLHSPPPSPLPPPPPPPPPPLRETHTHPFQKFMARLKRNKEKYVKGNQRRQHEAIEEDVLAGNPHPGALILSRLHRRLTERNFRGKRVKNGQKRRNDGLPIEGDENAVIQLNPPPTGREVQSLEALALQPNSYFVLHAFGLRIAVSLDEIQNGLEQFGSLSVSFRVTLISTDDVAESGLELWNGSLVAVLQRLLEHTVQMGISESHSSESAPRLIQINVANAQAMERQVSSGIFTDSESGRVWLIRALLDALLVTTNSSDNPTKFQELVITSTVTFPNHNINAVAGNGVPRLLKNHVLPFGIRLHKTKALGRKRPSGQVMYVKNTNMCWAVAIYFATMHKVIKKEILQREYTISKKKSDIPRRFLRGQILSLKKRMFTMLEKSEEDLLCDATQFFQDVASYEIVGRDACPDTFQSLARALNKQIVVLDESTNYKSTSIFPQALENGKRVSRYDASLDTIFLLRVRYPVVDKTKQGIGSESFYHYHGMVSASGLLRRQLKKICLYCTTLFDLSWLGHSCSGKKNISCGKCHRIKITVTSDHMEEAECIMAGQKNPFRHVESEKHWKEEEFCMVKVGEDEPVECSKCMTKCRSNGCETEHLRVSRCKDTRVCEKCGKPFVCLGDLAPERVRHRDEDGKVIRDELIYPTMHKNCLHSFCKYCGAWDDFHNHECVTKMPGKATAIPWGLGAIHMEMRRGEGGQLYIQTAGVSFHSAPFSKKNVDYLLLTDLVDNHKEKETNYMHHCSSTEQFDQIPYLEPSSLKEALKYREDSVQYDKESDEIPRKWDKIPAPYVSAHQHDPQFELSTRVKHELAKIYLEETTDYIRSADDGEVNRICSNLMTNRSGENEHDGDSESDSQSEVENAEDHDGTSTIEELLYNVGIDSESAESFAAFNDEDLADGEANKDDSQVDMESDEFWETLIEDNLQDDTECEKEKEKEQVADEEDNDQLEEEEDGETAERRSVAQRLIKLFTLAKFANFTISGYFDSGAEGALLLRECLIMGVFVKCTFQGRHVTSLTFQHKLRIINLRSYLPSALFKMADTYKFLKNWTWFPSHQIVLDNINEVWDTIPDESWWRAFNIPEAKERELFWDWHRSYQEEFDFNGHLVNHVYNRAILIMKIAMQFSHEAMELENTLLYDRRQGLLAGNNPVFCNSKLTYVCNNHPLSKDFYSMAGYAYWMFNRATTVRLPILQYHRHNNPAARSSMQEMGYLEWLYITKEPRLQFSLRGKQVCFVDAATGMKVYVDGFVKGEHGEDDRIYEILGCYHHGCLLCFPNGSPFEKLNKVSLVAANTMREKFLKQFGKVIIVWSHSISELIRDNTEFKSFYKKFSENDFRSFGWREGHTTGIVEAFGIYADAGGITEHWKKHRSDSYYQEANISQIDMNANYPSTLMKIKNRKLSTIIGQPAIPIPISGLITLFSPRIYPQGTCPKECWTTKCTTLPEEHDGECSIEKCHLSCSDHFNEDFYEHVSGMAFVILLPPKDLIYPLVQIPIDVTPNTEIPSTEPTGDKTIHASPSSQSRKNIVNFLALCRTCALNSHLCRMSKEHSAGLNGGEVLHAQRESCVSNINFHTTCTHSDEERAFEKVLPLNELAYILREGYIVKKYHSIRYFSKNTFWNYDEFMSRLSTCKVKAKGIPDGCEDRCGLRETLKYMNYEIEGIRFKGPDELLRQQFDKKPVTAKLCKMVGCLVIGKLAMDNDQTFTRLIYSYDEFDALQRDETLNIESYHMLNPYTLLVTVGSIEGGDRSLARSSCLLLASMVTAAARVNMFKVMYHLYRNEDYLTLYLGVDSLIVVPFTPWAQDIEDVLPMSDVLSGYFGYQHKSVQSAVIYGRNRYSILNKDTQQVEFKFSGLSGIRNARSNDIMLNLVHRKIAQVLLSETKVLAMPQAKVEISRDYMTITMVDEAFTQKKYHILDLKRGFMPFGILRNYCLKTRTGEGADDPSIFPVVMSVPLGYEVMDIDKFVDDILYLMQD